MRNNLFTNYQQGPTTPNETLKATALIYLRDALDKQAYEQCPDLIQQALNFGAQKGEIQQVIADYALGARATTRIKPFQKGKGYRRF